MRAVRANPDTLTGSCKSLSCRAESPERHRHAQSPHARNQRILWQAPSSQQHDHDRFRAQPGRSRSNPAPKFQHLYQPPIVPITSVLRPFFGGIAFYHHIFIPSVRLGSDAAAGQVRKCDKAHRACTRKYPSTSEGAKSGRRSNGRSAIHNVFRVYTLQCRSSEAQMKRSKINR